MEIVFLGTGNAFAGGGLLWTGFLVDRRFLFEAPPTALPALKRLRLELLAIEVVIISHFHGDHFAGLPFLYLEYSHRTIRTHPLTVIGPPGVGDRVEGLARAMNIGAAGPGRPFECRYVEVEDGWEAEIAGSRLVARRVEHAPDLQCFGFRFTHDGRVVAYSGDTRYCSPLAPLGREADLFIVECAHAWEENPLHMNLAQLQQLRSELGPRPPFVVIHRDEEMPLDGLGDATAVEPGETYRL